MSSVKDIQNRRTSVCYENTVTFFFFALIFGSLVKSFKVYIIDWHKSFSSLELWVVLFKERKKLSGKMRMVIILQTSQFGTTSNKNNRTTFWQASEIIKSWNCCRSYYSQNEEEDVFWRYKMMKVLLLFKIYGQFCILCKSLSGKTFLLNRKQIFFRRIQIPCHIKRFKIGSGRQATRLTTVAFNVYHAPFSFELSLSRYKPLCGQYRNIFFHVNVKK